MRRQGLFHSVPPEPVVEQIGGRTLLLLSPGDSVASGSGYFDGTLYAYGQLRDPQGVTQVAEIGEGQEMWFKRPLWSFKDPIKVVYDVKLGEEGLLFLAPDECGYNGLEILSRTFLQQDENAELKDRMSRGLAWSVFMSQEREG